jgi:hypothetical protein
MVGCICWSEVLWQPDNVEWQSKRNQNILCDISCNG